MPPHSASIITDDDRTTTNPTNVLTNRRNSIRSRRKQNSEGSTSSGSHSQPISMIKEICAETDTEKASISVEKIPISKNTLPREKLTVLTNLNNNDNSGKFLNIFTKN